jgi:glycosyltransferase involved in cell wall biosynthesis
VTDIRGSREIVSDRVNGLIVRPGDPEAMGEAIREMFSDSALRRKLSGNALRESGRYSIERLLGREAKILREVLDANGA